MHRMRGGIDQVVALASSEALADEKMLFLKKSDMIQMTYLFFFLRWVVSSINQSINSSTTMLHILLYWYFKRRIMQQRQL